MQTLNLFILSRLAAPALPCGTLVLTIVLILFAVGAVSAQTAHSSPSGSPKIAFTFDDLPAHGPLPPGTTREEIASKILAAFQKQHIPPVYGFVNGATIEKNPGDVEVLKM